MTSLAFLWNNLAAGLTASVTPSATSGLGVDMLNDPQPRHRLRVASTALSLVFDLGSAQAVDAAALLSTSIGSQDQVLLRGSASDATVGSQLLLRSQDFSNATWTKTECSVASTTNTAPDASATATGINDTVNNTAHFVSQSVSGLSDNVTVRVSIYAKAAPKTWCALRFTNKANTINQANFQLSGAGTIGVVAGGAADVAISSVGSGWYRVSFYAPVSSGGTTPVVALYIANGDDVLTYIGTGSDGMLIWGAQLDYGPALGTYVVSTAAAVHPALNTGMQSGATATAWNGNVVACFSSQTLRYWRWDVFSGTNPIDIGLAPLGLLMRPSQNFDLGCQEGRIDLSIRDRNPVTGAEFGVRGPTLRTQLITISGLAKAAIRNTPGSVSFDDFDRDVGASGDVLFIEDPDETWINRARDSIWGSYRLIGPDLATRAHDDYWVRAFRLTERL